MNLFTTSGLVVCFFVLAQSCNRKHYICPAYNSYFIHDKIIRDSKFSPFISDSLSDSYADSYTNGSDSSAMASNENLEAKDNTLVTAKYQPKEKNQKKALPNGLLNATSSKSKTRRAVEDIEMKTIMVKPISRYSNIDSSSIKKTVNEGEPAAGDTL